MSCDGLHALADAAARLERSACPAPPDLGTEREQRRLAVHVRVFEELRRKEVRQAAKATAAARAKARGGDPVIGKMLWKEFSDHRGRRKLYQGQVVSVHRATKRRHYDFGAGRTATVKYFVQYDDGDSEDMTLADVLKCIIE